MPPAGVHASSLIGANHADEHAVWQQLGAQLPQRPWRTRFAPAPTGYLHLGHLINALYVWGIARRFGGQVILRIEDHDTSRCRREYETALLEDLEWLG
ncbi:MAG: glutamate--tRNA ligase family protein, partial [Gemmatimonas sp.]